MLAVLSVADLVKRLQAVPDVDGSNPFASMTITAAESQLRRIESGDLVPSAAEIRTIAAVLDLEPLQLLYPEIGNEDRQRWVELDRHRNVDPDDIEEARTLAAALRWIREVKDLPHSKIQQDYKISSSSYHRLEQAERTIDKLSPALKSQIAQLFEVDSFDDVMARARHLRSAGMLDAALELVSLPVARIGRVVERLLTLDREFDTRMGDEARKVLPLVSDRHRNAEAALQLSAKAYRRSAEGARPAATVVQRADDQAFGQPAREADPEPANDAMPELQRHLAKLATHCTFPPHVPLEIISVQSPEGGSPATYVCARPLPICNVAPLGLLRGSPGQYRLIIGDEPSPDDFVVIAILAGQGSVPEA